MSFAELHSVTAAADLPERPARFYLPELDTLRFFAFLFVFISHVGLSYKLPMVSQVGYWPRELTRTVVFMGGYGVDLFFALSAYLLTRLFVKERAATGGIDVRSFYIRRILRIWPLYFFFIALIAGLGRFSPMFAVPRIYFLSLVMFLANFFYIPFPARGLSILWSVSVEEQFYLLWPQVIRRTSMRGTRLCALAMFAASTLAPSLARMSGHWMPHVLDTWEITFFRLHPFAVGILIGTIPHGSVARMRPTSRVLLIAGGLTLWFLAAQYGEIPSTVSLLQATLGYPAIALGAGAFLLAALGTGAAYPRLGANSRLVYLGRISYGLYVYHVFAMTLAQLSMRLWLRGLAMRWPEVVSPLVLPIFAALSAALTLCFAMASYRWLESPFLRLKDRFTLVPSRPV